MYVEVAVECHKFWSRCYVKLKCWFDVPLDSLPFAQDEILTEEQKQYGRSAEKLNYCVVRNSNCGHVTDHCRLGAYSELLNANHKELYFTYPKNIYSEKIILLVKYWLHVKQFIR